MDTATATLGRKVTRSLFRGWIVVLSSFCMTLSFGVVYSYTDYFLPLVNQFHWNYALASTIPSVSLISFSAGSIVGGVYISRVGFRRVCMIGSLLLGIGTILSSQINNLYELLLLFGVAVAVGNSFVVIAATSLVVKWFVKKRGIAVGIMASGSGVGTLFVPQVAESIINSSGWRSSFIEIGISFLFLLLVASFYMQRPEDLTILAYGQDVRSVKNGLELYELSATRALSSPKFWWIYVMFLLGTFAATIFLVHAAPIAVSYGMTPVLAAEAVGVFGAGSLSSRILLGALSDYLDRTRSVVLAFLSELVGLGLVAMIRSNEIVFLFAGFAIGFGYGGFLSDFISLVGDLFGRTSMEKIWAVQETAYGIGGLLGPILAGIYFDSTGNYFGILLVSTILVGLALSISIGFSVSYGHAETLRLS